MSTLIRHHFSCRPLTSLTLLGLRRALPLSLALGLVACEQDKPNCIATTVPYATKLIELERMESVPGACSTFGPASFNARPELGLSPYYPPGSDGQPDYDRGSLAVQSAELGTLFYTAELLGVLNTATDGGLYSLGDFATIEPDADDMCPVPTLSRTHVVLPEIPSGVPDDPMTMDVDESLPVQLAIDAALDWSNVRVYVTGAIFGTQMDGDLVDTRLTAAGDSCAIRYRALGIAPSVSCWALDEMENPLINPDGSPQLDPTLCDPEANPAAGRQLGSGISPSARFECNPVTAYCMIEGDTFPALR